MKFIKPKYVETINFISLILYPLSLITFLINFFKNFTYRKNYKIKTICIGNIYAGGTGKTPLVILTSNILKKNNKTVIIKKKYKDQIDEQRILKKNTKLICNSERHSAIKIAQKRGYEIAILDDGLQDKKNKYDISIACFNSSSLIGNGFLIPAGPLREKINILKTYDAIFLNGEKNNPGFIKKIKNINKKINIFRGKYIATNINNIDLKKKYFLFSGLGNPDEFERTCKNYKIKIYKKKIFPDHYDYSMNDIKRLKSEAKLNNLELITTEKDYLRLSKFNKKNIKFLKIKLKVLERQKYLKFLMERI